MAIEIKITDIEAASDYISLTRKDAWAKRVAQECVVPVTVSIQGAGELNLSMPEMYAEDSLMKSLYLMKLLAFEYLRLGADTDDMTSDIYDLYAGAHLKNQLERIKFAKCEQGVKDKVFDILSDYYDCERRLNDEIKGILRIKNDACTRILSMIFMQSTPESFQKGVELLKSVEGELAAAKKESAADGSTAVAEAEGADD